MTRYRFCVSQALALIALCSVLVSSSAKADMGLFAADQLPKFRENHESYSPLSANRLQEIGLSSRDYEMKSQYGLMDYNSETTHFSDLEAQKGGLMHEVLKYQADAQLKLLKARVQEEIPNSLIVKSTLLLGTAYLFCNGKAFTAHLSNDTELTGSAKLSDGTHALSVIHRNVYSLGFDSGIGYEMDSGSSPVLNATVSKEIAPHVVASVGQRRSLASVPATPSESTGQIYFGTSF